MRKRFKHSFVKYLFYFPVCFMVCLVISCGSPGDTTNGGSSGEDDSGDEPEVRTGSISGTVEDQFGEDLENVTVELNEGYTSVSTTTSDSTGSFSFISVEYGTYILDFSKDGFEDAVEEATVDSSTEYVTATLYPESLPSAGVMEVRKMGLADSVLTFEVDLFVVDSEGNTITGLTASDFSIEDGTSSDGIFFDYEQLEIEYMPPGNATAYSAALLLDQSGSIISTDPYDSRIQAAKVFFDSVGSNDEVLLSAFASNGLLPYECTYWGNFTSYGSSYFSTLEDLSDQESGGTPLYDSILTMMDYTYNNGMNENKAVVVFTDGADTASSATIDTIASDFENTGVKVFTVGLSAGVDEAVLGEIAVRTDGCLMYTLDARQLVSLFGTLGNLLDGTSGLYRTVWTLTAEGEDIGNYNWLCDDIQVNTDSGWVNALFFLHQPSSLSD